MLKVTFETRYKVKQGHKMVEKRSTIVEDHKNEADARLRALALNWTVVSVEVLCSCESGGNIGPWHETNCIKYIPF